MAAVVNRTSFAIATTYARGADGALGFCVSVKGSFLWDEAGGVAPTAPDPVVAADELRGEGTEARLHRARETGPVKPRVDVTVAGPLRFDRAAPITDVSLELGTELRKHVRVFGRREWLRGKPSRPSVIEHVEIDWARSFGGRAADGTCELANPAGAGFASDPRDLEGREVAAFERADDPIVDCKSRPAPVGFGPIAPHWTPRASRAGTFDESWRRRRAPLSPRDQDPRFFNVAPDDQQLAAYPEGAVVRLRNMTPNRVDEFRLPPFEVPVLVAADAVVFDLVAFVDTISIFPEQRRVDLVARAACAVGDSPLVHEVVIGQPTRAHHRAITTGKRYVPPRRREALG